jgi:hypothetical protein
MTLDTTLDTEIPVAVNDRIASARGEDRLAQIGRARLQASSGLFSNNARGGAWL